MSEVLVLAEHRRGELREISLEMLALARPLAGRLTALLLADDPSALAEPLVRRADEVLTVSHPGLTEFLSPPYQEVLAGVIRERQPRLVLMGQTAQGLDLAPSLAVELACPLLTDCLALEFEGQGLAATRAVYGGKILARVRAKPAPTYLATLRPGSAPPAPEGPAGRVVSLPAPGELPAAAKRFLKFVEAAAGGVDIGQADFLVSIGRGIGEEENLPLVEELAEALGATLSCSRPVADKKWLPKERQVGTSGQTVRPKVYLALGISGAFQHVAGMKDAGLIIAVNKDPKAPIFNVAHYGVVADLFAFIPALLAKVRESEG